jgi:hypothetical protein
MAENGGGLGISVSTICSFLSPESKTWTLDVMDIHLFVL